uniref:DOMON domain-containing protein n=1 Tax=Caenorhabditis japonica TaxID=281687 RepID=A0A8R1E373_CAEJA
MKIGLHAKCCLDGVGKDECGKELSVWHDQKDDNVNGRLSSTSNGTHTEIEIFGNDILDKTWLAIAYSSDKTMKDDFVVYCIRDDRVSNDNELMAGIAYNTDHKNEMIGTIKDVEADPKKDRFGLNLSIQEYNKEEGTLYCKMTHRVDPITDHFNMTKVEILMAKGVWINNSLTYHGKTRNTVGQVELSGAKKKKKNSASNSLTLVSTAVTLLATKIIFF